MNLSSFRCVIKTGRVFLLLAALSCGWLAAGAQAQVLIMGRITEASNKEPLRGAIVQVKGTNYAAVADSTGRYSIKANAGDTLVFQLVGFRDYQYAVGGAEVVNVALESDYMIWGGPNIPNHVSMGKVSVAGLYTGESWGYMVDYSYNPGWSSPRNGLQRTINLLHVGLRVADVAPQDSYVKIYPYVRSSLGKFNGKLGLSRLGIYPFVEAGYYADTDFSGIRRQGFGYGAGVVLPKIGFYPVKRVRADLLVGWSGYAGQARDNFVYLGLRIYRIRAYSYTEHYVSPKTSK